MKKKKSFAIFIPIAVFLMIVLVACNIAMAIFSDTFDLMFTNIIVHGAAENNEQTLREARALTEEIQGEGSVLLKNKDRVLPLQASAGQNPKIVVMGYGATQPYFGGTGSGSGGASNIITFLDGLTNANIDYNQDMITAIENGTYTFTDNQRGTITSRAWRSNFTIGEMKRAEYETALTESVKTYSDTAVVVVSRSGGEGYDLADEMYDIGEGVTNGTNGASVAHYGPESERGKHYLELSTYERDMISLARQNFNKVVLIVNANNPMELGFIEEHDLNIDSVLWTGGPGSTGWNAVAKILKGDITPSGHLASTYAYDLTTNSTYYNSNPSFKNNLNLSNFSTILDYNARQSHHYSNRSNTTGHASTNIFEVDNEAVFGTPSTQVSKFVTYEEGIYVGYRYYETMDAMGRWNSVTNEYGTGYDAVVQFPFGFGMSYTNFSWSDVNWNVSADKLEVEVTVTNTGDYVGRDVVQLYYSAPYTSGGIEKSSIVLGAFAKTELLYPASQVSEGRNNSQRLTLSFDISDMSSYDYLTDKAYVLDNGNYTLSLRTDVNNVKTSTGGVNYTYKIGRAHV